MILIVCLIMTQLSADVNCIISVDDNVSYFTEILSEHDIACFDFSKNELYILSSKSDHIDVYAYSNSLTAIHVNEIALPRKFANLKHTYTTLSKQGDNIIVSAYGAILMADSRNYIVIHNWLGFKELCRYDNYFACMPTTLPLPTEHEVLNIYTLNRSGMIENIFPSNLESLYTSRNIPANVILRSDNRELYGVNKYDLNVWVINDGTFREFIKLNDERLIRIHNLYFTSDNVKRVERAGYPIIIDDFCVENENIFIFHRTISELLIFIYSKNGVFLEKISILGLERVKSKVVKQIRIIQIADKCYNIGVLFTGAYRKDSLLVGNFSLP